MNTTPARLAAALALSTLAFAPVAMAQQSDPIIKLPLQPVVPAAQRACTTKTASGLGYSVLKPATGPKPGKTDFVLINYIGYLAASGAVFDQNQTTPLEVGNLIPGFTEALQLVPRGGIYRFCIPSALGYGAKGAGEAIPANSDLVFQVELVDSKTAAEVEELRKQQAAQEAAGAGQPAAPAQH